MDSLTIVAKPLMSQTSHPDGTNWFTFGRTAVPTESGSLPPSQLLADGFKQTPEVPLEIIIMNTPGHYSLDNLAGLYPANMRCESCFRTTVLSVETQQTLLGEIRTLDALYGRLICSCGSASFFLHVTFGPVDGERIRQ